MSEGHIKKILNDASIARQVCTDYDEIYVQAFLREVQRFNTEPLYEIFQQVYVRYTALLYRTGLLLVRILNRQINSKRRAEYARYTPVLFNLAYIATHILRDVYELAYERDLIDSMVKNLFRAKVKNNNTDCKIASVYVETSILNRLKEICASANGGIEKSDFCNHLVYFTNSKERIDAAVGNRHTDSTLYENYIGVWNAFQSRLVDLVFKNFINFYNENIVKCMVEFINQQTQIKLQYIETIEKLKYDGLKHSKTQIKW